MPNIKSAIKRVKTSSKSNEKNAAQKSALRTSIRSFETAVAKNEVEVAKSTLLTATKKLDKAVSKGLIHKNAAARKKSRLVKKYQSLAKEITA